MKDEPKKRGRKPRAGGEAAAPVTVKLTAEEREQYMAAAEAVELSLAEWIRAACSAELARAARRKKG